MTVFEDIYRENRWNGVESLSGPGSGSAATRAIAGAIAALVEELDIGSVLDVACGDGFWMPDVPHYLGIDVSPAAIDAARRRHPARRYEVLDARTDRLPGLDLAICRDAIQHLPLADGRAIIDNVRRARIPWLLASTYRAGENVDVEVGECFSPDLEAEPFDLGEPALVIFDGYHYHEHDTDAVRDPRKYLALWRLGR